MSKNTYRTPQGFKEIKCEKCGVHTIKVDAEAKSATCFRCVSKGINPESVILTDLSQEEYKEFVQRMFKYGRSKNNTTESAV
jgi:transposase